MEIKVTIPKYMNTQMKKVSVDEVEFNKDLIEFIENLENKSFLDEKLQQKLLLLVNVFWSKSNNLLKYQDQFVYLYR